MPEIIRISLDVKYNDYNGALHGDNRIDPISIGMCNIDVGTRPFYAVCADFNEKAAASNPRVDKKILQNIKGEERYTTDEILTATMDYLYDQTRGRRQIRHIEFWGKTPEQSEQCLSQIFYSRSNMMMLLKHTGAETVTFKNIDDVTKIISPVNPSPFFGNKGASHALRDASIQADMFRWAKHETELAKKKTIPTMIKTALRHMAGFRPF